MLIGGGPQVVQIPRLRQDLYLNPGPVEPDGSPTWTLYDPAANKYFKIGWLEFECLTRFSKYKTAPDLIEALERETPLSADDDTIKGIIMFLLANHLIQADAQGVVDFLTTEAGKKELPFWKEALHHYLYFTVPIFKPDRFLKKTYTYISFLFTRGFFYSVLFLLFYGLFLTLQRPDEFMTTFMSYMNAEGVALLLIVTVFTKVVHELGHAYMAVKYGVPVPTMGVAFMVMYPVLYTETSNAWRMSNRRQRVMISMAGVMAETVLAAIALILWHALDAGIGQSIAFMVAVVTTISSLLVNTNPLMRFDGYYIFADLVGIDNLQERACAMAKWRIRRILWGWDDPLPEAVLSQRRRLLEVFGFALLIYRFFLYVGIAALVYHLFFKPLGLILFIVEVAWFLFLPIWKEARVWWEGRERIMASRRGRAIGALTLLAMVVFFIPVQNSVEIPAVLHAESYTRIFPTASGRIERIYVTSGEKVMAGQVLFDMSAPDLQYDIDKARHKLDSMNEIRNREQSSRELFNKRLTLDEQIVSAGKELSGLLAQQEKLTIRAAYAGVIRDMDKTVHEGQWVHTGMLLCLLVDPAKFILSGYVREHDHDRIAEGGKGYFYADDMPFSRYPVTISQIEQTDAKDIFWPELASVYGGPLPAERRGRDPLPHPLSRYTLYGVKFALAPESESVNKMALPGFVTRGSIEMKATPISPFNLLIKKVLSVFVEESGF